MVIKSLDLSSNANCKCVVLHGYVDFGEGFKMYPSYCLGSGMLWLCVRHVVDVEFPMWVNSKSAIKGIIKILKHVKQVVLLRFAKVGELFDNIIHIHLFILGVQDCCSKAVWIVPVPAKDCFLLTVCFEGLTIVR